MGMCMSLMTLSDTNRQTLLNQPELVSSFVNCSSTFDDSIEQTTGSQSNPSNPGSGMFSRLFGKASCDGIELHFSNGERQALDLDKYWHAIHFLLDKLSSRHNQMPLDFIMSGGTIVGDKQVGTGPSRVFNSTEIQLLQQALRDISVEQLAQLFDEQELDAKGIYPFVWSNDDSDIEQYCLSCFHQLKSFINNAAKDGLGMLVYM